MLDEGLEVIPVEGRKLDLMRDAGRQRRMNLHPQSSSEAGKADEPERSRASGVEGEVEKAREVRKEAVGEMLGFIDDDDRDGVLFVEEADQ